MTHPTGQTPISEYARLLRVHATLIVAAGILCAVAALVFSIGQDERYEATASLQFNDQSTASGLAGEPIPVASTPEQLAAQRAQTVLSGTVLRSVRTTLGSGRSLAELRSDLDVEVNSRSNLVSITASAPSAGGAARLADTVARKAVMTHTGDVRASFARSAKRAARRLRSLRESGDPASRLAVAERLAPLQALAAGAEPVTIADSAERPDSPAAPKPLRDTIIGLFTGLLLGVVLAFARDSLDRRLKSAADVQSHLERPVVTRVRAEAMGLVPYIAGERERMAEQDVESFRILRANLGLLSVDSPIRLVAVTSPMPEEGKSTVAASLALASVSSGRTLLLECDLRRPTLAPRLGAESRPGLTDYLAGSARLDDVAQVLAPPIDTTVERPSSNGAGNGSKPLRMTFIAAGSEAPLPAELLGSRRFGELLEEVKQKFDTVIVDTAPLLSVADTIEILPLMDALFVCIRVDRTTREQAVAARASLDRLPQIPAGVVITGLRARDEGSYGYYSYEHKRERSPTRSA